MLVNKILMEISKNYKLNIKIGIFIRYITITSLFAIPRLLHI